MLIASIVGVFISWCCELFIAVWCSRLHLSLRPLQVQTKTSSFFDFWQDSLWILAAPDTRFLHYLPCAMAKSDTWPGGVAMESLSNMASAGSCDSVISMNSRCVSSPLGLHISCPLAVRINTNLWHSTLRLRLIENKGKERTEGGVLLFPLVCLQTTTLAFITSWRQSRSFFLTVPCLACRVKTAWSTSPLKSERVSCIWRKPSKLWRCRRTVGCPTMNPTVWLRGEWLIERGSEVGGCSAQTVGEGFLWWIHMCLNAHLTWICINNVH